MSNSLSNEHAPASVQLMRRRRTPVRSLKGFRKSHQVPGEYSDWTAAFAARIAAEDLNEDIGQRHSEFRRQLGLRRVDMQVSDPEGGCAAIRTPGFEYRVEIQLAEDSPSEVEWCWQLGDFGNAERALGGGLDVVFSSFFDTVEFQPVTPVPLEGFVDALEAAHPNGVEIDYDHHLTWCRLQIRGLAAELLLTSDSVALTLHTAAAPTALLAAFQSVQRQFLSPRNQDFRS